MRFMTCIIDGITVETALHELHCSDLFHPAVTVKSGMQHLTFAEIHSYMENYPVTKKGNHITELGVGRINFIKAILLCFRFVPVLNAEIRIVIKFNAKLPAVKLADESPAVKEREFSAVRCVSDEKIMVKPHI